MENYIYIPAIVENWQIVYDFLVEHMKIANFEKSCAASVIFASEEIYVNISRYAYPGSQGNVLINFEHDPGERLIKVSFVDDGIPFDPTKTQKPDSTKPVVERKIGGLGIFIVNKITDGMEYAYKRGQNNLVIIKKTS